MGETRPLEHDLRQQIEAAKSLLAGLRDIGSADDDGLVADSIEGETDLLEALDAAIAEIDDTEALIEGLSAKERQFKARRETMEKRVERLRALIEQSLVICGFDKPVRRPTCTLSLRKGKPSLIVESEAEVPAEFFVPQPPPPPKLDKEKLRAALAERDVPGARLSNGSLTLSVRRS